MNALPLLTAGLLLALTGGLHRTEPVPAPTSSPTLPPEIPICGAPHVGGIPAELLRQPVALRQGLGTYPSPTSTKSPEAQAFFEQGMAYLHGYVWVEAARSFHQALRADSTLLLAHVGLSRIYSQLEDSAAARREARRAGALERFASERERAHLAVRVAQLRALDDLKNDDLLNAYRRTLKQSVRRFPEDSELALLIGNAQERYATGRGQGSTPKGIAVYEEILKRYPEHPAAHHYLVHSYEGAKSYDKALAHGDVYARLAPGLPHAGHMYAHDLMKIGQLDAAIRYLSEADSVERSTYETERYQPDYDWHHAHNLSLLALCYQYQGRMAEAEAALKRVYALVRPGNPEMAFYTKKGYLELLVARERFTEAETRASDLLKAKTASERLLGHYIRGLVRIQHGHWADAQRESAAAGTELTTLEKTDPTGFVVSRIRPFTRHLTALLDLHAAGARPEAPDRIALDRVRKFQQSARDQSGPDGWIEALFQLETIAQLALEMDLTEFAGESAQVLAAHDAGYAGTHHTLAQVARKRGDQTTAKRERTLARAGWQRADGEFRKRMGFQ
jgi:tetratricopeptide (TPR) repeat protein